MHKSGSAILIVILLSSILVSLATIIIRNVSNIMDIAIQREAYEQEYYAFVGLLNYSKTLVSFYSYQLQCMGDRKEIILNDWQNRYKGAIFFVPEEGSLKVTVQLAQNNQVLQSESYTIKA
ncbi:MAG TPA: hypothetical protein PLU71_01280 [Candidatus Dependentiae bacterium]|nr:hypothetical protein [Candidatus Dependentiae bacterium]HRQ62463.1 hypothetical protein [Candidatus Dependentiae bacterium]